ncbi:MAG: hypothetical protein GX633_01930 [Clostridiales bacterium]|nr:hypothetical protein [Clostridiales bacterium]
MSITISSQSHNVTLPAGDMFTGNTSAIHGSDYTFTVLNYVNYTHTVTATMNGVSVSVSDNGNGTYTVPNVTGSLVISATSIPNSYNITFATSTGVTLPSSANAVFGTDYIVALPMEEHYTVSVTSVMSGNNVVPYSIENGAVKIAGSNITGAIVITFDRTQSYASVSVIGTGADAATGYTAYATPDNSYTLNLALDNLYDFTVTAKVNDTDVNLTVSDSSYTIAASDVKTGSIVFTVNKALKISGITVYEYVGVGSQSVWLIVNETSKLIQGSVYAIDGNNMFWSEKYSGYCTLKISSAQPTVAASQLSIATADVVSVNYSKDVNMTGKLDANDAQLVYDIYNALYSDFGTVTAEKFLRADVNGSRNINMEDASAIINTILQGA